MGRCTAVPLGLVVATAGDRRELRGNLSGVARPTRVVACNARAVRRRANVERKVPTTRENDSGVSSFWNVASSRVINGLGNVDVIAGTKPRCGRARSSPDSVNRVDVFEPSACEQHSRRTGFRAREDAPSTRSGAASGSAARTRTTPIGRTTGGAESFFANAG